MDKARGDPETRGRVTKNLHTVERLNFISLGRGSKCKKGTRSKNPSARGELKESDGSTSCGGYKAGTYWRDCRDLSKLPSG